MPDYSAGEARLAVVPDASDFKRRLEADLRRVRAEFAVQVQADTTTATAEMDRWIAAQSARDVTLNVDVDTAAATAKIAALGTTLSGIGNAGGGGTGILGALGWNAGALAVGSLPAMATAIADVAGAIQQLAGAGLVIPGVVAGMVASAGTAALGFKGMGEALSAVNAAADGTPESLAAADAALKELEPNAAAVVRVLGDFKPQFEDLQNVVQQNMFAGVSDSIRTLVETDLPILQTGMGGIATAWSGTLNELTASLSSEDSQGLLTRILGNTEEAQNAFTEAIDPLVSGIGTLTAAGTDALPRLAEGIGAVAERFSTFITAADKDGRLDDWINNGLDGITDLGNTVLNLGKTFTAITQAAGGGQGLLGTLESATNRLQTFLNSARGQEMLTRFFTEGREQLDQWLPILQNVGGMLGGVYEASKQWTDALLPPLQQITGFLAEHPGLIENVATAFLAWKTIDGVTGLLGTLGRVTDALGVGIPGAANKGASGISAALGRVAVPAWLTYLMYDQGKSIYDNATQNDARFPGQSTPTDPTGERGMQNRTTGGTVMGVPSYANDSAFQSSPPASPPPARTNDIPPAIKPSFPVDPNYVPVPGPAIQPGETPGYVPGGAPNSDNPFYLGPKEAGGPTPSGKGRGPTGGWMAEVHSDEWILPSHARAAVGDEALWALTEGRSFAPGGYIDQYGNPVSPGVAPGGSPMSVAPSPYGGGQGGGGGGLLQNIIGNITSGIQAPLGNALGLAQSLPGAAQSPSGAAIPGAAPSGIVGLQSQHGVGTLGGLPGVGPGNVGGTPSFADNASQIPGIWGLFGSLGSSNPLEATAAWGTETLDWLANWGVETVGSVASTLWQGALGFFGLENSILSPSNSWNQAVSQGGQFALGQEGPLGALMGGGSGPSWMRSTSGSQSAAQIDPIKIRNAQDKITDADTRVAETKARLDELPADAKGSTRIAAQGAFDKAVREAGQARDDFTALQQGRSATSATYGSAPSRGSEKGLQINTIQTKRAIESAFPQVTEIGGYRQDALKWHPNGLALDVMIPNWDTPEGKALGDQIYAFVGANAGLLGVDMDATLWQVKDHYNHVHVATTGGGYPSLYSGGPTPSWKGPVDAQGGHLAVVHPDEFVVSARGRATVPDEFLYALNDGQLAGFAPGGPINIAQGMVQPPRPRPNFNPGAGARTRTPATPPTRTGPSTGPAPTPAALPAPQPGTATPAAPPPTTPANEPAQPAYGSGIAGGGVSQVAAAPDSLSHVHPALSKGIQSAASTIGSIAASAASGGMGAAGMPGGGLAGQMIQGLAMQGGKIIENIANIPSSFLVGNLTPGTTPSAYGQTLRPAQNVPNTAPIQPGRNLTFNGISDVARIMQEVDLRDKQDQAIMAGKRSR